MKNLHKMATKRLSILNCFTGILIFILKDFTQAVPVSTLNAQWTITESDTGVINLNSPTIECSSALSLSLTPSTCNNCFGAIPQGTGSFTLFYAPRNGQSLDFDRAQSHVITVSCPGSNGNGKVTVFVRPNFGPSFGTATTQQTVNAATKKTGAVLDLRPTDPENDILSYELVERPNNGFFTIDSSGIIRANKDLNTFCSPADVTVTMKDSHNPPIKKTITMDPGGNTKPVLTTWNQELFINENTPLDLPITDALGGSGRCLLVTNPARYQSKFDATTLCPRSANSKIITVSGETFDFENDPPINISLVYDNGNCPSDPRWLHITWRDVPEPPVLKLDKQEYTTDEGFITFTPEYQIIDDDFNENHTYSFVNDRLQPDFRIDPKTGKIFTPKYLNIDCEPGKDEFNFEVRVTDKTNNVSNEVPVRLKVNDINDKRPYFVEPFGDEYSYSDCAPPQKITDLLARDDDCNKQTNGAIRFVPAKTSSMSLNQNGELVLGQAPVAGQVEILTVEVTDRGEPPLVSEKRTITLRGTPCPTTQPPATVLIPLDPPADPTAGAGASAGATATASAAGFFDNPWNIILAVLGGLLGLLLLGLLGWLLYRFCCRDRCYRNRYLKPQKVKPGKMSGDTGKGGAKKAPEGGVSTSVEEGFVEGKGKMIGGYRIKYGGYVNEYGEFSEGYGYGAAGGGGAYGGGGGGAYGAGGGAYGYGAGGGGSSYGGGEGLVVGEAGGNSDGGYWKEHYMDKEMSTAPSRTALPATAGKT